MKSTITLMLALLVIITMSCKKENTPEIDNPNIIHRVLNKEIIAKADLTNDFSEFDIDNNGVSDFAVELNLQKFSKSVRLLGIPMGNASLGTAASNEDPYITSNISKKTKISTSSNTWSQLSFLSIYKEEPGFPVVDAGYAGSGDVLAGVQFLIDGTPHFGWILINVSSGRKYVIVKEVAYDIRANTEILAGEK